MATKMFAAVLPISEVFADFERNFRDPAKDYADCQPTEGFDRDKYEAGTMAAGFFEDILLNGIQTPIVVVKLTEAQKAEVKAKTGKDYIYRLAKGHRRVYTAGLVNAKFPGTIVEVNALVYEGLTPMQEWELLADHSPNRREAELSGTGVYRAVIKLHAAGFSQEKIGNMMGKAGRGYAQRHVNVFAMRLTTPVERHWLGVHLAKDDKDRPEPCYKLTNKNIDDLHPAFNSDKEAGRDPMALGSEFRKEWDKIASTGKSSNDSAPKAFKRDDILARKTFADGRPALEQVLDFAANNGGSMETAVAMYDRLADKAAKSDELIFKLDALTSEAKGFETLANERLTIIEGYQTENTALRAEIDALRAEIDALRAEAKPAKSAKAGK